MFLAIVIYHLQFIDQERHVTRCSWTKGTWTTWTMVTQTSRLKGIMFQNLYMLQNFSKNSRDIQGRIQELKNDGPGIVESGFPCRGIPGHEMVYEVYSGYNLGLLYVQVGSNNYFYIGVWGWKGDGVHPLRTPLPLPLGSVPAFEEHLNWRLVSFRAWRFHWYLPQSNAK